MDTLDWTPLAQVPTTDLAASSSLTPEQKKAIRSYREWIDVLLGAGTLVRLIASRVGHKVKSEKAKTAIMASGHALYDAMRKTQDTLADLEDSVRTGKAPARPMPPVKLPSWNPDDKPENLFELIWGVLQPGLQAAYEQWGGDNTVGAVIYTVILAGKQMADDFAAYYPKA